MSVASGSKSKYSIKMKCYVNFQKYFCLIELVAHIDKHVGYCCPYVWKINATHLIDGTFEWFFSWVCVCVDSFVYWLLAYCYFMLLNKKFVEMLRLFAFITCFNVHVYIFCTGYKIIILLQITTTIIIIVMQKCDD